VYFYSRWDDEEGKEVPILNCGNPCKFQNFKNMLDNSLSGEWMEECQELES